MCKPGQLFRAALLGGALTAFFVVGASAAAPTGAATVEADSLRLREEANTESSILDTAPQGTAVVVLGQAENGWYNVSYGANEGYMSGDYLTFHDSYSGELGHGQVAADGATLNLRSAPNTDSEVLAIIPDETVLELDGVDGSWYLVTYNDLSGYVSGDYISLDIEENATSTGSHAAVGIAKQFLGVPYVYGANGPSSFDCSGFTSYVYRQLGYSLNRTASDQLNNGYAVSKSELQPGDLVFFRYRTSKPASHVGMYIGNGEFIHASTNGYQVRIDQLVSGHYSNVFVGARRIGG